MRYDMIQACIDVVKKRKKKVNYLEIGVQTGYCFFKIKADKKLAVDPEFIIKLKKKVKAYIKNISNFNNEYYELTSDDFFAQKADYLEQIGGIDVAFIDGLHLREQVAKDIENTLKYLNKDGIILVHDCNPITANAAVRAYTSQEVIDMNLPGYDYIWNGDVWEAIVELRATRKDLDIAVINSDHGVGVIQPKKAENTIDLTPEQLKNLSYEDLAANRQSYLNLKPAESFPAYIKAFEQAG
jgi:hypothetical protein